MAKEKIEPSFICKNINGKYEFWIENGPGYVVGGIGGISATISTKNPFTGIRSYVNAKKTTDYFWKPLVGYAKDKCAKDASWGSIDYYDNSYSLLINSDSGMDSFYQLYKIQHERKKEEINKSLSDNIITKEQAGELINKGKEVEKRLANIDKIISSSKNNLDINNNSEHEVAKILNEELKEFIKGHKEYIKYENNIIIDKLKNSYENHTELSKVENLLKLYGTNIKDVMQEVGNSKEEILQVIYALDKKISDSQNLEKREQQKQEIYNASFAIFEGFSAAGQVFNSLTLSKIGIAGSSLTSISINIDQISKMGPLITSQGTLSIAAINPYVGVAIAAMNIIGLFRRKKPGGMALAIRGINNQISELGKFIGINFTHLFEQNRTIYNMTQNINYQIENIIIPELTDIKQSIRDTQNLTYNSFFERLENEAKKLEFEVEFYAYDQNSEKYYNKLIKNILITAIVTSTSRNSNGRSFLVGHDLLNVTQKYADIKNHLNDPHNLIGYIYEIVSIVDNNMNHNIDDGKLINIELWQKALEQYIKLIKIREINNTEWQIDYNILDKILEPLINSMNFNKFLRSKESFKIYVSLFDILADKLKHIESQMNNINSYNENKDKIFGNLTKAFSEYDSVKILIKDLANISGFTEISDLVINLPNSTQIQENYSSLQDISIHNFYSFNIPKVSEGYTIVAGKENLYILMPEENNTLGIYIHNYENGKIEKKLEYVLPNITDAKEKHHYKTLRAVSLEIENKEFIYFMLREKNIIRLIEYDIERNICTEKESTILYNILSKYKDEKGNSPKVEELYNHHLTYYYFSFKKIKHNNTEKILLINTSDYLNIKYSLYEPLINKWEIISDMHLSKEGEGTANTCSNYIINNLMHANAIKTTIYEKEDDLFIYNIHARTQAKDGQWWTARYLGWYDTREDIYDEIIIDKINGSWVNTHIHNFPVQDVFYGKINERDKILCVFVENGKISIKIFDIETQNWEKEKDIIEAALPLFQEYNIRTNIFELSHKYYLYISGITNNNKYETWAIDIETNKTHKINEINTNKAPGNNFRIISEKNSRGDYYIFETFLGKNELVINYKFFAKENYYSKTLENVLEELENIYKTYDPESYISPLESYYVLLANKIMDESGEKYPKLVDIFKNSYPTLGLLIGESKIHNINNNSIQENILHTDKEDGKEKTNEIKRSFL